MQHHPGSWYIPWGMPLQKMLAVPFNPAAAAAGYHQPNMHQPQIGAAAVQSAPPQNPQQTGQQNYQHHQIHSALHHNSAAAAAALQQQLHPAAAAMFTPLTLRSFVAHPHLNLGQQPMATAAQQPQQTITNQTQSQLTALNFNSVGVVPVRQNTPTNNTGLIMPMKKVIIYFRFLYFLNSIYYAPMN